MMDKVIAEIKEQSCPHCAGGKMIYELTEDGSEYIPVRCENCCGTGKTLLP